MNAWSSLGPAAQYSLAFFVSLALAYLVTPLAARLAGRWHLIDTPSGHSTHTEATPVLGGLAVGVGFLVIGGAIGGADGQLLTVLACACVLAIVGLVDDHQDLSPWVRLTFEAVAGIALWSVGVRAGLLGEVWFDLPLTIVWVVAIINAFNMIDNHDGIAASVAAMCTLGAAAVSASSGYYLVTAFALAVAGACLGFLWHNKPPATIFLGDAGSMFLGLLVAALTLKVDLPHGTWATRVVVIALLAAVPLFDLSLVVSARLLDRRPIMLGSTDHTTHRLRFRGWSKSRVVVGIAGVQAMCSALAWAISRSEIEAVSTAALIALVVIWPALLVRFLKMTVPRPKAGAPDVSREREAS
jgi:UDP-GlcNAc:undecaprenyl-phosphate GlcNAc-1-phosphate transferase